MTSAGIELKLWSNSSQGEGSEAAPVRQQLPDAPQLLESQLLESQLLEPQRHARNWLASLPLLLIASIAASSVVGLWEPGLRFQPSFVGMLWAGTFLSGYLVGSLGRGQLWGAVVAVSVGWTTLAAFEQLTDLGPADSLLLTALNLLAGWATAAIDPTASPSPSVHCGEGRNKRSEAKSTVRRLRWSIWEIGFVTAIVACVSHAWPRLNAPPELMLAVAAALLAGLIVSWLACRWVWKDDWSLLGLAGLTLMLAASLAVLLLSAPPGQSLGHWLRWLLCGPVNVVSAQGLCVLATLGVWRQGQPSPPGLPGNTAEAGRSCGLFGF